MIRVLLVHDICLFRWALTEVLDRENDIDVSAATTRDAAERVRALRPDVCVVDAESPEPTGPGILRKLSKLAKGKGPGKSPALLVLGSAHRPGPLRRAFEAEALGYVDKEASPVQLTTGIRQVAEGKRFIDGSLGFGFLQAADIPLTRRELSVLSLAAEGSSVSEIAGVLHLSTGTVRNYMSAITRKTGARNRVDAIRISRGEGWL